jgi:hypothetical protein
LVLAVTMACWNDPGPLLAVFVTIIMSPHADHAKPTINRIVQTLHGHGRVGRNVLKLHMNSI